MKQFSLSLLKCLLVGLGLQSAILAAPTNDSFSAPTVVTGLPATATGSNVDATLEVGEPLPTVYAIEPFQPAEASVWFVWTSPVTGSVQIDTAGSDLDTILAVWTGSTLATLSEVDSNDYYFGSKAAVYIDVVQGTTYHIAIYGYEDARGEISLSIENDTQSRISGVVTGPDGTTPLAGIDASAFYKVGEGSEAYWEYGHYGITRPDGSYTIRGLKSDTYRVQFADIENGDYQTEHYDNVATIESAADIIVAATTTVTSINASLELASKITGTVTGPDGTIPLSGIFVSAYEFDSASGSWFYSTGTETLPDGSYRLGSLAPGSYRIEFDDFKGDYFSEYYDNAVDIDSATNITVGAVSTVPGINASLTAASKITGTVTGPDGTTPLQSINILAYQFNDSSNTWNFTTSTFTNSDGTYRLGPLEPGTYRVQFGNSFSGDYLSEYYENAPDIAYATSITVPVNTTVPNINASLETGSRITGIVTGPNGTTPIAGISIAAFQFNSTFGFWSFVKSTSNQLDGTYQLGALEAGTYRIGFSDLGGNYLGEFFDNAPNVDSATSIAVGEATTVSGINASLALASMISGTVTGPNGVTPLEGISVVPYQSVFPYSQLGLSSTVTQADGTYQVGGLVAGTYRIGFRDPSGNYVSEYFNNASNVNTASNITVANSTTVSGFNASLALASKITGTVTGPNGTTPLGGISVAIYQSTTPYPQLGSAMTQADGSYQLGGLVAGNYRIGFRDTNGNHITEYYQDALEVNSATNVTVPAGATVNGIDASLVLPTLPEVLGFRKTGPTSFEMSFTGTPGNLYWLQESTSLTSWRNIGAFPFTCQHGVNLRTVTSSESKVFWRLKSYP